MDKKKEGNETNEKLLLYLGGVLFISLLFSVIVLAVLQLTRADEKSKAAHIQEEIQLNKGESSKPANIGNEKTSESIQEDIEKLDTSIRELDELEQDLTIPSLEIE